MMRHRKKLLCIFCIALVTGLMTSRAVSQSSAGRGAATVLIPHESWTCGMADGIPSPESGTLVFEAAMKFESILNVGKTPYGNRQVIVAQDGTLSGPKLSGTVMPGALDFELKLSNGTIEIEQPTDSTSMRGTPGRERTQATSAW